MALERQPKGFRTEQTPAASSSAFASSGNLNTPDRLPQRPGRRKSPGLSFVSAVLRDYGHMGKVLLFFLAVGLWAAPVDDARRALSDAAHSKEGDQRREAALALSLVPAKDPAVALLDRLAKDKDYQVRLAAIET